MSELALVSSSRMENFYNKVYQIVEKKTTYPVPVERLERVVIILYHRLKWEVIPEGFLDIGWGFCYIVIVFYSIFKFVHHA